MNEFVELMSGAGTATVEFVIVIAETLTRTESAPGMVALALFIILVLLVVLFLRRTVGRLNSIRQMERLLAQYTDVTEFSAGYARFCSAVDGASSSSRSWNSLKNGWDEFRETIVEDEVNSVRVLRNSIRPTVFLNVEDLHFGPGWFRIVPNLFVSFGLLMTFLGLVAALRGFSHQVSDPSGGSMDLAMQQFMQIASAKFIMSLAGLVCSILFTIVVRVGTDLVSSRVQNLCHAIERRLSFVSLEDLGFRQLRAATEQREHLREIGFAMVAELRKPLDALPDRITETIADKINPILQTVSTMGTSNMQGLVGDLSSQLSHSVGNALTQASVSLSDASDRIGLMVDRMNNSNAQAGEGLQSALAQLADAMSAMRGEIAAGSAAATDSMARGAEQMLSVMNETLGGIRESTSRGSDAMANAAENLRQAAEGFRAALSEASADGAAALQARMAASTAEAGGAIEAAGQTLLAAFGAASQDIARLGAEMGGAIGEDMLGRIQTAGAGIDEIARALQDGAANARLAANELQGGAQAIGAASSTFASASRELTAAADPLRAGHERIELALRRLDTIVGTVSATLTQSSTAIAENAHHVLATAQAALGNEREGIRAALQSVREAMSTLTDQAEQLDHIDGMLGRALTEYNAQLDSALGSAQDHVARMRDILAPGIDTLKSVVEQAESFMPAQRRA